LIQLAVIGELWLREREKKVRKLEERKNRGRDFLVDLPKGKSFLGRTKDIFCTYFDGKEKVKEKEREREIVRIVRRER
jgi:hypothetical protein